MWRRQMSQFVQQIYRGAVLMGGQGEEIEEPHCWDQ